MNSLEVRQSGQCDMTFGEAWTALNELKYRPVIYLTDVFDPFRFELVCWYISHFDKPVSFDCISADVYRLWIEKLKYKGSYSNIQFKIEPQQ